jgi:predicted HTH transcriptional regulator
MTDGAHAYSTFEELTVRTFDALNEMIDQRQEESLHLEFKTLSGHDVLNLTKDDRRLIAKSVCGFSNAEGGLLVLGVETSRIDGVDVATSLKPFKNFESLRNRVVSALPELLSPQNSKMAVLAIPDVTSSAGGYIAIHVPPSDVRPHMSLSHHQYFRRGSDGTRVQAQSPNADERWDVRWNQLRIQSYFVVTKRRTRLGARSFHSRNWTISFTR